MNVQEIQRAMVEAWLQSIRLPLTLAEAVLRPDRNWPPAVAFAAFESNVMRLLGSVRSDEALGADTARRTAQVTELQRAARLQDDARQLEVEAEARFQAEHEEIATRRAQEEQAAKRRRVAVRRRRAEQKRQAEEDAQRKQQTAHKATKSSAKVAAQKPAARASAGKTLAQDRKSVRSKRDVIQPDEKRRANARARRTG
jgi:hypothetical protein